MNGPQPTSLEPLELMTHSHLLWTHCQSPCHTCLTRPRQYCRPYRLQMWAPPGNIPASVYRSWECIIPGGLEVTPFSCILESKPLETRKQQLTRTFNRKLYRGCQRPLISSNRSHQKLSLNIPSCPESCQRQPLRNWR